MKELTIPNFITAKSPEELRRKMFAKQVQLGMKLHFFNIGKHGSGLIAWYEVSMKREGING